MTVYKQKPHSCVLQRFRLHDRVIVRRKRFSLIGVVVELPNTWQSIYRYKVINVRTKKVQFPYAWEMSRSKRYANKAIPQ